MLWPTSPAAINQDWLHNLGALSYPGDGLVLTDDEWDATFNDPDDDFVERPTPRWARLLGAIAALAMLISSFAVVVNVIQAVRQVSEPAEIVATSWDFVDTSDWGWLVSEVVVTPISEPDVGAFVTNNPPDGIIHVDLRGWDPGRLDELMAHEIGHLIEFAAYPPGHPNPRGGIEREVWAECAAVDAGERSLDGDGEDAQYRCTAAEYAIFVDEMAAFTEVCRPWREPTCRRFDAG